MIKITGKFNDADVLFTVVTDGYGNIISLNNEGEALAQVELAGNEDGMADPASFAELARLTCKVLDGDAEPLHEAY